MKFRYRLNIVFKYFLKLTTLIKPPGDIRNVNLQKNYNKFLSNYTSIIKKAQSFSNDWAFYLFS